MSLVAVDAVAVYNLSTIRMQSLMLLFLVIFQLSGLYSVCHSNQAPLTVRLAELPVKKNQAYLFRMENMAAPVTILRNANGTFLNGQFSRLTLAGQRRHYEYASTGMSFKYPAQHRVANVNNELLELQIQYQLVGNETTEWKHRKLAVSVTFLLTEFAPPGTFTLGRQINQKLTNGTIIDLGAMLRLVPHLSMVLYKGTHSDQPNESGFLWLVRKELLLMSEVEFQQVKSFIYQHQSRETLNFHGLTGRLSDLNEIQQLEVIKKAIEEPI